MILNTALPQSGGVSDLVYLGRGGLASGNGFSVELSQEITNFTWILILFKTGSANYCVDFYPLLLPVSALQMIGGHYDNEVYTYHIATGTTDRYIRSGKDNMYISGAGGVEIYGIK